MNSNCVLSASFSASGINFGSTSSTALRSTGKKKQMGSFSSNLTHSPGRVNCQFIVKVYGDQSVSIIPLSGMIASFGTLGGPLTERFEPGTCSEQALDVEGQHAATEKGHGDECTVGAGVELDLNGIRASAPVPARLEAARAEDLPTMRIGDGQGQTAIGE